MISRRPQADPDANPRGKPMSVSIQYRFRHQDDLHASGALRGVEDEWDKAFGGTPYQAWNWQAAEKSGTGFLYSGATRLPDDVNQACGAIQIASDLLSRLRNSAGGSDWRVSVDDQELPWDAKHLEFNPDQ
jgi:hypothetical protein